ncbi:hypothetical protein CMI45_03055 [Candidatus Pacearchaeota archaeon]|nr:hypothetical protein [Candidatus Pacearchaeota archaeon]|tara:strand:- start:748 stop:1527 length:780 start_codon:yes stop_codon:yes gene_type:complete
MIRGEIGRRGQAITIWVIIAIALIGSMILFFSIERPGVEIDIGEGNEFFPSRFIEKCARDAVNDAVDLMLPHGGFVDDKNSIMYNGINISYLCLNKGNYGPCVSQHPSLLNDLKEEVIRNSEERIGVCFDLLKEEVESRWGTITIGEMNNEIDFAFNRIFLTINRKIVIEKQGNTERFDKFDIEIINSLYDLALIGNEISSEEAKYCYFEYVGYNVLHQRFDIEKTTVNEGTKIYSIKDKETEKEMNLAIRGCAIPAGL